MRILRHERLLATVDRAAKRRCSERSRTAEEQDRAGYVRKPHRREEWEPWQEIQAWPEDVPGDVVQS